MTGGTNLGGRKICLFFCSVSGRKGRVTDSSALHAVLRPCFSWSIDVRSKSNRHTDRSFNRARERVDAYFDFYSNSFLTSLPRFPFPPRRISRSFCLSETTTEGREVRTRAAKSLGVRVNLFGEQEQSTSTVATCVAPRWLKDFNLRTSGGKEDVSRAILTVELFDGESKKTLAKSSFPLGEVVKAGLIPGQWVALTDVDGAVAAEVCLRLRFKEKDSDYNSDKSSSPSVPLVPSGGSDSGTNKPKSLEERARAREARTKARESRSRSRDRSKTDSKDGGEDHLSGELQQQQRRRRRRGHHERGSSQEDRTTRRDRRSASRERRARRGSERHGSHGDGGLPKLKLPKLKLPSFKNLPNLDGLGVVLGKIVKEISPGGLLVAAAGIFVVGNFSKIRGPPQFYEVQEGDSLCTIAECYNKDWTELLDKNANAIEDPNVIYPGDRIRLI